MRLPPPIVPSRLVVLCLLSTPPDPTRSDPLQIVLTRACKYGRGACAEFTLTRGPYQDISDRVGLSHAWPLSCRLLAASWAARARRAGVARCVLLSALVGVSRPFVDRFSIILLPPDRALFLTDPASPAVFLVLRRPRIGWIDRIRQHRAEESC